MTPQQLEPLTLPLFGERLIEASAGTGKTFTIGILYLRLLLGLGKDKAYSRCLTVEEILVVTFTKSATKELKDRIRDNIHRLRIACVRGFSNDFIEQALLNEIIDPANAAAQLLAAERQIDEAAIYTIHSFCQRMLATNAFESGILFEQTLIYDELPLRQQACTDFWRRHCYPLTLSEARAVNKEWSTPEELLKDLSTYLQGEVPQFLKAPYDNETISSRHQKIIMQINELKTHWQQKANKLEALINNSAIDKRSYNSKYLPHWIAIVNQWAEQKTNDYSLPKELNKFRQSILYKKCQKDPIPQDTLFLAIDCLFKQPLTLRDLIMAKAINEIRASVQREKQQRSLLGFDDLLNRLDIALQQTGGKLLAKTIRHRYPLAIIDEFQDTDPQQYRIFQCIYADQADCGLLLIGDPKQAIYAFRGADIFTYIHARSKIDAHYTLLTNWRSSNSMVQSINKLFNQIKAPFLFKQIPFISVTAAAINSELAFQIDGKAQPALQFWLQPGESVSLYQYQQLMAQKCATQIRDWLIASQFRRANLITRQGIRPLEASDITILVRSHFEAILIRNALITLAIPSIYLSNQESVFDTQEAKDLFWLLQAVLLPEQERILRCAMATSLLGLNAQQLDNLNNNEHAWDILVNEFDGYRQYWRQHGILPMLRKVITKRHLAENLLVSKGGERRLTNLLHLGELLQETAVKLDSNYAVIRWLAQQIAQPECQSENQQLRLENAHPQVQIITIHKSKGLEYSLVWLPFISSFYQQSTNIYHDQQNFNTILDLYASDESQKLAQKERLAEDLRLLYVALTRSIYHCSIGIAPIIKGNQKKHGDSDLHKTALGYLIQGGQSGNAYFLAKKLAVLQGKDISVSQISVLDKHIWQPQKITIPPLAAKYFTRKLQDYWRVTSYSGLQQQDTLKLKLTLEMETLKFDSNVDSKQALLATTSLTPHHFPRGIISGIFLHSLLEELDFSQLIEMRWLSERLLQHGFDSVWLPVLHKWLSDIAHTSLNETEVTLAKLALTNQQKELQFCLPIERILQARELDNLVKYYDSLSAMCPILNFEQVQGILKGFIDLVFCWQDKFYLLDYKSNWLGGDSQAYSYDAMVQAMIKHRYDIQYQLYTLALHRYLRHRLINYDYQRHFGGVIYLFLRGINQYYSGNGIFTCRPQLELVKGLDRIFSKEKILL